VLLDLSRFETFHLLRNILFFALLKFKRGTLAFWKLASGGATLPARPSPGLSSD
jgi:hypothetical protein